VLAVATVVVLLAFERLLQHLTSVAIAEIALMGVVLAFVLAACCAVAWRLTASGAALRLSAASGLLAVALGAEVGSELRFGIDVAPSFEFATVGYAVTTVIVVTALRIPDVAAVPGRHGWRLLGIGLLVALGVEAALGWPFWAEEPAWVLAALAGFAGLASLYATTAALRRARSERHVLAGWLAAPLLLLAAAAFTRAAAHAAALGGEDWLVRSHLLTGLALSGAVAGALRAIHHAFRSQDRKLYAAHRRVAADASLRADQRRRVHQARNAMLAIEGATSLLSHHYDRLPPEDRQRFSDAIRHEVRRLQQLMDPLAADVGDDVPRPGAGSA